MPLDVFPWAGFLFVAIVLAVFASSAFFIVHTKQAAIIERLGNSIASPAPA